MLVSTMTAGKANNFAIRARSQHLIQKSKPGDCIRTGVNKLSIRDAQILGGTLHIFFTKAGHHEDVASHGSIDRNATTHNGMHRVENAIILYEIDARRLSHGTGGAEFLSIPAVTSSINRIRWIHHRNRNCSKNSDDGHHHQEF